MPNKTESISDWLQQSNGQNKRIVERQQKKIEDEKRKRNEMKHERRIMRESFTSTSSNSSSNNTEESSLSLSYSFRSYLSNPKENKLTVIKKISLQMLQLKTTFWFLMFRYLTLIFAFISLLTLTIHFAKHNSFVTNIKFNYSQIVLNSLFLIEGIIKVFGLYALSNKLLLTFRGIINWWNWIEIVRKSGVDDIAIATLCLIFVGTEVAAWLALLRVSYKITNALQRLPLIGVIMVSEFRIV